MCNIRKAGLDGMNLFSSAAVCGVYALCVGMLFKGIIVLPTWPGLCLSVSTLVM